mgnify:CR=1 FL=1
MEQLERFDTQLRRHRRVKYNIREIMRSLPDSTVNEELTVDDLVTDALGS